MFTFAYVYVNNGIPGIVSQGMYLIQMYHLYIVANGEDNLKDYWFTQNRYGISIVLAWW